MKTYRREVLIVVLILGATCAARGDDQEARHRFFHRLHQQREGTPPPLQPRHISHTDERAGFPRAFSGHLEPSATPGGIGYYVGGGVPLGKGDGRRRNDGTWGWDDTGSQHLRRRTMLGWSGGRKYQGGTGAYRTDGPVVPDLIYATTSTFNSLSRSSDSER